MIETLAGSTDLATGVRPGDQWRWGYQRASTGVQTWSLPASELAPGLSMVRVSQDPMGQQRLSFEGNLTAALHGPDSTCGSLLPSEVHDARDALLGQVHVVSGIALPEPSDIRLTRLDPSATYSLPEGVTTGDVLRSTLSGFSIRAGGRAVARHHYGQHGETVTLSLTKARSWSAYDKAAEYRKAGKWTPHGELLRLEARVRPGKVKSDHWKGLTCTFELTEAVMDAARNELEALTNAMGTLAAGGTLTVVRALIRGGATPNEALRLASVAQVATEFGWGVVAEMGVPERTSARWRSELRRFLEQGGGADGVIDDAPALIRSLMSTPVLAKDVAANKPPASDEGVRHAVRAEGAEPPRTDGVTNPRPKSKPARSS